MEGFTGGEWAYATNTNDTSGVLIDSVEDQLLKEKERRLACYYLGWESIKVRRRFRSSQEAITDIIVE